jgi:hypothetical protein
MNAWCRHTVTSRRIRIGCATSGALLVVLSGCGGGSDELVVRPPATHANGTPSASASPSPSGSVTIDPHVTVKPSRHLHDGQTVSVSARGFGPDQSLIIIECVDLGKRTGQSSCDIGSLTAIVIGPDGTGSGQFTVRKGPIGSERLSCTDQHPCIVSVSQATLNPTQTASATIRFD